MISVSKMGVPSKYGKKLSSCGENKDFSKKKYKAGCFIEVQDIAVRVLGRNLGSHCPMPCLPLSGLQSLVQNVSKFLVAPSNSSKPSAAFRGGRQDGEGQGAAEAQKERGGRLGIPACSLLQVPAPRQSLHTILPSFKIAASRCWPLLPEGGREQKHQQTASLEGFTFPVITHLLIPEVYQLWADAWGMN